MIEIISQPACARCKKLKQMLKDNGIVYAEQNLFSLLLDTGRLEKLLEKVPVSRVASIDGTTAEGFDPSVPLSEKEERQAAICFLQNSPSRIFRPVIFALEDGDPQTEEDLRRIRSWLYRPETGHCQKSCPSYTLCADVRLKNGPDPIPFLSRKTPKNA